MYNAIPSIERLPADGSWRARTVGYCTDALWQHLLLLTRLHYKARNQHRSSLAFHRLQEVKRAGRRLGQLESWLKINLPERVTSIDAYKTATGYTNTLRRLVEKVQPRAHEPPQSCPCRWCPWCTSATFTFTSGSSRACLCSWR